MVTVGLKKKCGKGRRLKDSSYVFRQFNDHETQQLCSEYRPISFENRF